MQIDRIVALSILVVCFLLFSLAYENDITTAQATSTSISGKFYKFDRVSQVGSDSITWISNYTSSINDSGTVAFSGRTTGVDQVFARDVAGPLRFVTSPTVSDPGRSIADVQINNSNKIVTMSQWGDIIDGTYEVRVWDANAVESSVLAANARPGFNPPAYDMHRIWAAGLNNAGLPAFTGDSAAVDGQAVFTGFRPTFNNTGAQNISISAPIGVADNGSVVLKEFGASSPIKLYSQNLQTSTEIATLSSSTFSSLGKSPGITDDGNAIAFYGDTSNRIDPNIPSPGPGIFVSIPSGTRRALIKVAGNKYEIKDGGNNDRFCQPSEQCYGELGVTDSSSPIYLSNFNPDSRVGVIHQEKGSAGPAGDIYVVAFIASPNLASPYPAGYFSNQIGLWTVRMELRETTTPTGQPAVAPLVSRPVPVLQIGDRIGSETVSQLSPLFDPIAKVTPVAPRTDANGDHQLVFKVNDSIYRATQTDFDQDGLYDHWETTGIDFNNDRTVDLPIHDPAFCAETGQPVPTVCADINRKDIFVEIDYMVEVNDENEPKFSHHPERKPNGDLNDVSPLAQVRTAFANAPPSNPVGGPGIALHTMVDEELRVPEYLSTFMGSRGPLDNDDFDDIKNGSNGPNPGNSCGNGPTGGHFGRLQDRVPANANCQNILGARYLAFRYAIFGNALAGPDSGHAGSAEVQGNDLLIAVGRGQNAAGRGYNARNIVFQLQARFGKSFDEEWAGMLKLTFMHELGHTLGLLHGGHEDLNCKPNYLSVMSYSRSLDSGGLAFGFPSSSGIADRQVIRLSTILDYSRDKLERLNEGSLDERIGIRGPVGNRTIFNRNQDPYISPTNGAINWDGGSISNSPISQDINRIRGIPDCLPSTPQPNETLNSFNDWQNITYNYRNTKIYADGNNPSLSISDPPELDLVTLLDLAFASNDVDNDSVLNVDDNCMLTPNPDQSDSNSDGVGNACDIYTNALADLMLNMSGPAQGPDVNTPIDLQITVSNNGPNSAGGVTLTNQLPAQLTFVSATASQGTCSGTTNVTCNLGVVSNAANAMITIRVIPAVAGRVTNNARVAIDPGQSVVGDPNISNNEDAVTLDVTNNSTTYSLSGTIKDANHVSLNEVVVNLTGSQTASVLTNSNGEFSFPNLPSGGYYSIAPSKYRYRFDPPSHTFLELSDNQTINFTGITTDAPSVRADFDGDGKTDISVFRPGEQNWYILRSLTNTLQVVTWGAADDRLMPGDYDGDKKTDFAVWRTSDGVWYVLWNYGGTPMYIQWGLATDIPVAGDYDGDGKTDVAVWRPSTGVWYILRSSDWLLDYKQFGVAGDIPLVGDFDNDRRSDFAVFTPGSGLWQIDQSTLGYRAAPFGLASDKLAPADYDGNGSTDFGVFRPGDGHWYTSPSAELTPGQNYTATPFGASGDIPTPGDYDGDGRYDRAIFRPSTGYWWILRSSDLSSYSYQFGVASDKPIPKEYLP